MNSRRFSNVNQSFKETLQGCPCHVPVGAVPLVATEFYGYTESLAVVTKTANTVYRRFLRSDEGKNFSGQVMYVQGFLWGNLPHCSLTRMQNVDNIDVINIAAHT